MQITESHHDSPSPMPLSAGFMQDLSSHPNRRARRISLGREVQLRMADREGFVAGSAQNVSATGMFVRCQSPRPPGTVIGFEFSLADGSPTIRGRSEVMWVRHRDAGPYQPAGMGLRFLDLDPGSRQMICWLVEKRSQDLRRDLHPGDSGPQADTGGAAAAPCELEELCNEVENALAVEENAGSSSWRETDAMEGFFAEVEAVLGAILPPAGC